VQKLRENSMKNKIEKAPLKSGRPGESGETD